MCKVGLRLVGTIVDDVCLQHVFQRVGHRLADKRVLSFDPYRDDAGFLIKFDRYIAAQSLGYLVFFLCHLIRIEGGRFTASHRLLFRAELLLYPGLHLRPPRTLLLSLEIVEVGSGENGFVLQSAGCHMDGEYLCHKAVVVHQVGIE